MFDFIYSANAFFDDVWLFFKPFLKFFIIYIIPFIFSINFIKNFHYIRDIGDIRAIKGDSDEDKEV